jgi:hypothetical protein
MSSLALYQNYTQKERSFYAGNYCNPQLQQTPPFALFASYIIQAQELLSFCV